MTEQKKIIFITSSFYILLLNFKYCDDLILRDIQMPVIDCFELCILISASHSAVKIWQY